MRPGTPPAVTMRLAMYAAVSAISKGCSTARNVTRCFNCRRLGSSSRVRQLWLPGQDDRKQLGRNGFNIREKADLFEHLETEALRFVDDEGGGDTGGAALS